MGWKYKKTLVAAKQNRPDVAEKRARWHEQLAHKPITGLVFVDESGANTQMTRWRGRALGGRRLVAHVPHGSYQTSTLISGIRWEGPCAPWLFEDSMNGEMFLAWVERGLPPTLREGDLVILDKLATHKIRGVREVIPLRGRACSICRPILPISIPSNRSGARSSKSSADMLRGRKPNSLWPPKQPSKPSPSSTAGASFLAPNTLHHLWKCSSGRGDPFLCHEPMCDQ